MNSKDLKLPILSLLTFALLLFISLLVSIVLNHPANKSLDESIWQLVLNIVIAIVTGSVSLALLFNQRTRKKLLLEYHVNDKAPLFATKGTETPNPDAIFKDKKGSLYLVTLKLQNSGNTSITPKDFSKDLTLFFGDDVKILKVDVLEKKPNGIKLRYMTDDNEIFIEPLLLNKKNAVTLAVLLKGFVDKVDLIGEVHDTEPQVHQK